MPKLNDKTAIKPVMMYGAECWAVRKKEERKLHPTEMRQLDHVRNVDIWKEAHVYPMAELLRVVEPGPRYLHTGENQ